MYCENCGAKLNDGAKFCHNCGKKVVWQKNLKFKAPNKSSSTLIEKTKKESKTNIQKTELLNSNSSEFLMKPIITIKKVFSPFGIITSVLSFVSAFLLSLSYLAYQSVKYFETYVYSINSNLVEASRWIGIFAWIILLISMFLLLARTIIQSIRIRKNNIKKELPGAIILGGLTILFFIIMIKLTSCEIFNKSLFNSVESNSNHSDFVVYMGLVSISTLFASIFSIKTKTISNQNLMFNRSIGLIILFGLIYISFVVYATCGGFNSVDYRGPSYLTSFSGYLILRCIVAIIGFISIIILLSITTICLEINENKNSKIVLWSIFGGITLVLFIILAVMLKKGDFFQGNGWLWETQHTEITILSYFVAGWMIPCGCVLNWSSIKMIKSQQ